MGYLVLLMMLAVVLILAWAAVSCAARIILNFRLPEFQVAMQLVACFGLCLVPGAVCYLMGAEVFAWVFGPPVAILTMMSVFVAGGTDNRYGPY